MNKQTLQDFQKEIEDFKISDLTEEELLEILAKVHVRLTDVLIISNKLVRRPKPVAAMKYVDWGKWKK